MTHSPEETWVILGASSAMARAFARKVAAEGAALLLGGRDIADLSAQAADAKLRGAPHAAAIAFDARDAAGFDAMLDAAKAAPGTLNVAVFMGSMPDQADIDADPGLIDGVVADSFTGAATFLQRMAPLMEERGRGFVVGTGSVAGDRGRVGNYVYGAAKAGFHTYLSGLRNRLGRHGVHVMTVKPGFVDSAMTWGLEGLFLVASPEDVAEAIWTGAHRGRNVLYVPWFWIGIMTIIRSIPERIFKKLSV